MNARLPKYVPVFLISALAVTACGDGSGATPTAPSGMQAAMLTAEPSTIVPQLFPTPFCRGFSPFGAQFTIVIRPSHDLFVRMLRFHFVDRSGVRRVPAVVPLQSPSSVLSTSGPVTIPTSPTIPFPGASLPPSGASTIPIPGVSGFDPLLILGGTTRMLPFFLQFGCGIPADGTVFVDFDLGDRRGRLSTSQLRVRLRG